MTELTAPAPPDAAYLAEYNVGIAYADAFFDLIPTSTYKPGSLIKVVGLVTEQPARLAGLFVGLEVGLVRALTIAAGNADSLGKAVAACVVLVEALNRERGASARMADTLNTVHAGLVEFHKDAQKMQADAATPQVPIRVEKTMQFTFGLDGQITGAVIGAPAT